MIKCHLNNDTEQQSHSKIERNGTKYDINDGNSSSSSEKKQRRTTTHRIKTMAESEREQKEENGWCECERKEQLEKEYVTQIQRMTTIHIYTTIYIRALTLIYVQLNGVRPFFSELIFSLFFCTYISIAVQTMLFRCFVVSIVFPTVLEYWISSHFCFFSLLLLFNITFNFVLSSLFLFLFCV